MGAKSKVEWGNLKDKLDADKKISRSFRKYDISIKAKASKRGYFSGLDLFMKFAKLEKYDDILKLKPDNLQDLFEDWIMSIKSQTFSNLNVHFHGLAKFLDINRAIYWSKPIKALFPRNYVVSGKLAYTNEDIIMMLDHKPNHRAKCIILFFESTGGRPGGIDDEDGYLQIKHLEEMSDGCACLTIYADTPQEYWAFLTPEAYHALKKYHALRKAAGEIFTPETPIFGIKSHNTDNEYATSNAITSVMQRIVSKSVPRKKLANGKYDKSLIYGFRKRFNTILKINNDVNSNIAEKLMAHKRGLDGSYLTPTREECFAEFKKAIPDLTIDPTEKLRVENRKLKSEDNRVTEEKIMQVFDLEEADMSDLKDYLNQKRKDRKYK